MGTACKCVTCVTADSSFMVNKKDNNSLNNTQVSKSNQTSDEFFNGDYSLIYDVSSYSDQFWNSKNSIYSAMTNKEYFFNKYMSQVANQSSSTYGGNLAMPLKPDYTMHYRIYNVYRVNESRTKRPPKGESSLFFGIII